MIKQLNSRYKHLRLYLQDFRGSLLLARKTNLKYFKYILEKEQAYQEKRRRFNSNKLDLNLHKKKIIKGKWGSFKRDVTLRKATLTAKQGFRHFYSVLKEAQIRKYMNRSKETGQTFWKGFVFYFEMRLDVVLYRLNFFVGVKEARDWFCRPGSGLLVNGCFLTKSNARLKVGDILTCPTEVKKQFLEVLLRRIRRRLIYRNSPKYILTNYRTMCFIIRRLPFVEEYFTPASVDLRKALAYFRV